MTKIADVFKNFDFITSAYSDRTVGACAQRILAAAEAWGEASTDDERDLAAEAYDEAVKALVVSGEDIPWHTWIDEAGEVVFAPTAAEAMAMNADTVDFSPEESTIWINYGVQSMLHDDGDAARVTIDPTEPTCTDGREHVLENRGVRGNGGGVITTDVCCHCGLRRTTDTWAQDDHGEQGLTSISYEMPGDDYADDDAA